MLDLGLSIWRGAIKGLGGGASGDATPGGLGNALLLENGNGIQLEDGSGVLLLED